MKVLVFLWLAFPVLLTSCVSPNSKELRQRFIQENDSFIGKTYDDLVRGKGVPTGAATLSDQSKVAEYQSMATEVFGGGSYTYPTTSYIYQPNGSVALVYIDQTRTLPVRSLHKLCKISFSISRQNIVERWKYEGNGCY